MNVHGPGLLLLHVRPVSDKKALSARAPGRVRRSPVLIVREDAEHLGRY